VDLVQESNQKIPAARQSLPGLGLLLALKSEVNIVEIIHEKTRLDKTLDKGEFIAGEHPPTNSQYWVSEYHHFNLISYSF
jgi:hypothetical protein